MNTSLHRKQLLSSTLLMIGLLCIESVIADNLIYSNNDPEKNNRYDNPIKFKRFNELSSGNKKIAQALFNAQFSERSQKPIEIELATAYWSLEKIASKNIELNSWGHVFELMKLERLIRERNLGQVIRNHSDMMHTKVSENNTEKNLLEKKAAIVITNARGEYVVINRTDSIGPDSL